MENQDGNMKDGDNDNNYCTIHIPPRCQRRATAARAGVMLIHARECLRTTAAQIVLGGHPPIPPPPPTEDYHSILIQIERILLILKIEALNM